MSEGAAMRQGVTSGWDRVALDATTRSFRVGANALIEFIREHHEGDILRELVQNEYDAHGHKMEVAFGQHSLRISGYGRAIDAAGWKRLRVIFGTGAVFGDEEEIPAKTNSIGSKNFGLRTLFLLGDRIYIRSGGWQTVLSIDGVPAQPLPEPETRGRRGVEIEVPYRTKPTGKLLVFDAARERAAFQIFATQLGPMLMKLAEPGGRSLESLTVSSARHDRQLLWRQTAKQVRSFRGVRVLHRRTLLESSGAGAQTIRQELEYQRSVSVPSDLQPPDYPAYYRIGRSKVRVGCSLPIVRRRPVLTEPGIFYYPLGGSACFTGNAISVSAPFEMNAARTAILAPGQSPWNGWLLAEAAQFTCELLTTTWFAEFGASAYLAAAERDNATVAGYIDRISAALKEDALWPTRAKKGGGVSFATSHSIVVPTADAFDGLLAPAQYLHKTLSAAPSVRALAAKYGVRTFTMNSAVRLRCIGEDDSELETRLAHSEANYYYTDFPRELQDIKVQRTFARAFDAQKMSPENRADLRNAATTLAADGSLQAPAGLWIIPPELMDVCDIPKANQLHPALTGSQTLQQVCKRFSVAEWVRHTAQHLNEADENTRLSLYRQIIAHWQQLSNRTIALLRRLPVLLDHRGTWQKPCELTIRSALHAHAFTEVLHFPHKDFAADTALARALRFKQTVDSGDVVALARFVADHPDRDQGFEALLDQLHPTLANTELGPIAFLRGTDNLLHAPHEVYLRTPLNEAALGHTGLFPSGTRHQLYERLGCLAHPRVKDILQHLAALRAQRQPPAHFQLLYTALVKAMRRERTSASSVRSHPIIWNGTSYSTPEETLLGNKHRRTFLQAVPQPTGLTPRLDNVFRALGVPTSPQQVHWQRLFKWFADKYRSDAGGPITHVEVLALRSAYGILDDMPAAIHSSDRCLLDDRRYLHSLNDARTGTYLIDDDRDVRVALDAAGTSIGFADTAAPEARRFYAAAGVRYLSDLRRHGNISLGRSLRAPAWFHSSVLRWVHSHEFAYALAQVAAKHAASTGQRGVSLGTIRERVARLRRVKFHDTVHLTCTVGGNTVHVLKKTAVTDGALIIAGTPLLKECLQLMGLTVAEVVWQGRPPHELITPTIVLVESQDERALRTYLELMGIRYDPSLARKRRLPEPPAEEQAVRQLILAELVNTLGQKPPQHAPTTGTKSTRKSRDPLPALHDVLVQEVGRTGRLPIKQRGGVTRSDASRTPMVPDEQADRALGRHAEALVYRHERERVAAAGYDPDRVVWTAGDDPDNAADYDIASVDDDGEVLWIEVKATRGSDGYFRWTRPEFERAVKARNRYVVYRVYDAASKRPKIKKFRDPVGLLARGELRIDVASLYAQVEGA